MRTHDEFYIHLRLGLGAVTLCVKNQTTVGVSFCAPNEQFSRKLGRTIAHGRAVKAPHGRSFQLPGLPVTRESVVMHFELWLDGLDALTPRWIPGGLRAEPWRLRREGRA